MIYVFSYRKWYPDGDSTSAIFAVESTFEDAKARTAEVFIHANIPMNGKYVLYIEEKKFGIVFGITNRAKRRWTYDEKSDSWITVPV